MTKPFTPVALVKFRKRFNAKQLAKINEYILMAEATQKKRAKANKIADKRIEKHDAKERNAVESKFGEGKRKYGLARIFAKLKETSECMIAMQFLVMSLDHKLRVLLIQILFRLFGYENPAILV